MSTGLDDFRERAQEEWTLRYRLLVCASTAQLWVGAYDLIAPGRPGGLAVWGRRYDRPDGKTDFECLTAGLVALSRSLADGKLYRGPEPE